MAVKLALDNGSSTRPSSLLNSIFMSTANTAAKSLVSVASKTDIREGERWKPADHFRYMVMLMIWFTVWVLRVLMDFFPSSVVPSAPAILESFVGGGGGGCDSSSLSLVFHEGFAKGFFDESSSTKAISRALSHIFSLLNEIPATSRKYQFALAMADKIVDENAREDNAELREINRTALSAAFARTSKLLYLSLQTTYVQLQTDGTSTWPSRVLQSLPLGSYLVSYLNGLRVCLGPLGSLLPFPIDTCRSPKQLVIAGEYTGSAGGSDGVMAEKLAQELLWITNKLRFCLAVEEAVVQWSFASGLASLSLTANPRVQGYIVKISAILIREVARGELEAPRQVKFGLLALWLPLFCYASNGVTYPVLTGIEKAEMERMMEEVIGSLPSYDQEIILANWLQDFTISASDWPNLQRCYDIWCRSSRKLLL